MKPPTPDNWNRQRLLWNLCSLNAEMRQIEEFILKLKMCIGIGRLDDGYTKEDHTECLAYWHRKLEILKPCLLQAEKENDEAWK